VAAPAIRTRTLAVGPLAFTAREAGEGPLVLLIHGFPDGPETFDAQLPALAAAGFHAVAPTLRGYERSSRPGDGSYRLVDLAADVKGWMDALGAERAHLVGHDWGATIAYAAAVAAPERAASLTMIAVPHPMRLVEAIRTDPAQRRRSAYMTFFQLKGLADWWMGREGASALVRLWRRWSPGWTPPPAHLDAMRRRFADPVTLTAALTYYRQALDAKTPAGQASAALFAGEVKSPVLGLCGAADGCIGADVFERAMDAGPFPGGAECETIPDAGHFVHAERPGAVNAHLVSWLRTQS
jgi:pimeloyl-ACP methyl ester carboxylesterase